MLYGLKLGSKWGMAYLGTMRVEVGYDLARVEVGYGLARVEVGYGLARDHINSRPADILIQGWDRKASSL